MTEIRKLAAGEIITEPGFYEMPLEQHHSQPCMSRERLAEIQKGATPRPEEVSVTSGILRGMELKTPADVWAFHLLNPERYKRDETPALRLGKLMAYFVEGGSDLLLENVKLLPADKPNRPTQAQIAKAEEGEPSDAYLRSKEFWDAFDADPRSHITQAELDTLIAMGIVLARDPAASAALGGLPEITMAWQDDRTGIWCLSRPDQLSLSGLLSDYKKTSGRGANFDTRTVDRAITNMAHDMQMAFADVGFRTLTGESPDHIGLVFQLDAPPYHVILRGLDEEDIALARYRNRRSIDRFAECLVSGRWPGPGEHVGNYIRPEWQRERLLQDMQIANAD